MADKEGVTTSAAPAEPPKVEEKSGGDTNNNTTTTNNNNDNDNNNKDKVPTPSPEKKTTTTLNVNATAFTPGKATPPVPRQSQPHRAGGHHAHPHPSPSNPKHTPPHQQQRPPYMPPNMPPPPPQGGKGMMPNMMMGPNGPMPMPMPMPNMVMGPNGPMPMPMFPPGMFVPGMPMPFPPGMMPPPGAMPMPPQFMPPNFPPMGPNGTPKNNHNIHPHHINQPHPNAMRTPMATPPAVNASAGSVNSSKMTTAPAFKVDASPPRVSVGNAALAAVHSKEPPKFCCVLLSGIPAVGKTTLGRRLVEDLKADGMGWAFFSGADFLQDVQHKRSVWQTTKEVFEALSKRLDELIEQQQKERNIKGLVIDKNCKGIEDVYYLNALLKSKNIPFVGIVGMECDNDDMLIERMGGESYLCEKLKYHRVIHARIVNLAKTVGMYRSVDATKSEEEVVRSLRTMVLGCAAQPPSRGIRTHHYDESRANIMVDSFEEYCGVMNRLFELIPTRNQQFPGTSDFVPFSVKEMTEKKRVESLKARYGVRSKVDGQRYILLFHNEKLYLIPPHMRAVLVVPSKAWLGKKLTSVGAFVLEGVLVRMNRDRQKEKFLVFDALFWSDAESTESNNLLRMDWKGRQACLRSHLCPENEGVFFPADTDCMIVHHLTRKISESVDLLDTEEFPTDGLVFQPLDQKLRSDHTLVWQQPSSITVDFRVGKLVGTEGGAAAAAAANRAQGGSSVRRSSMSADPYSDVPVRSYTLEVYDKVEKEYVQYEDAVVEVRHPEVVPGCLIACSLKDEVKRGWLFKRIRYDLLRPDYKHYVDELLTSCLVPRAKLVSWLMAENIITSEIQKDNTPQKHQQQRRSHGEGNSFQRNTAMLPNTAAAVPPANQPINPSAPLQQAPPAIPNPTYSAVVRGAVPAAQGPTPVPTAPPVAAPAAAAAPNSQEGKNAAELALLASIVPSLQVVVQPPPESSALPPHSTSCAQCKKEKSPEDLRQDKRDGKFYCYSCWSRLGYGFCVACGEFKELPREKKGRGRNNNNSNNNRRSTKCKECLKKDGSEEAEENSRAASKGNPPNPNENKKGKKAAKSSATTPAGEKPKKKDAGKEQTDEEKAKKEAKSPKKKPQKAAAKNTPAEEDQKASSSAADKEAAPAPAAVEEKKKEEKEKEATPSEPNNAATTAESEKKESDATKTSEDNKNNKNSSSPVGEEGKKNGGVCAQQ